MIPPIGRHGKPLGMVAHVAHSPERGWILRAVSEYFHRDVPIGQEAPPAAGRDTPSPVGRIEQGKLGQKNYAVGLEIRCPGGAYLKLGCNSQRGRTLASRAPRRCDMDHNLRRILKEFD